MMLPAGRRLLLKTRTVPLHSYQGDCGGEVVVVGVEAVSPRGAVDRRVLTADVDASFGLITWAHNL